MGVPVYRYWFRASGRRNRKSYLLWNLYMLGFAFLLGVAQAVLIGIFTEYIILGLITVPSMFITAQRFRDFGWSGRCAVPLHIAGIIAYGIIAYIVPSLLTYVFLVVLLLVVFIMLGSIPGTKGENKYGPNPIQIDGAFNQSNSDAKLEPVGKKTRWRKLIWTDRIRRMLNAVTKRSRNVIRKKKVIEHARVDIEPVGKKIRQKRKLIWADRIRRMLNAVTKRSRNVIRKKKVIEYTRVGIEAESIDPVTTPSPQKSHIGNLLETPTGKWLCDILVLKAVTAMLIGYLFAVNFSHNDYLEYAILEANAVVSPANSYLIKWSAWTVGAFGYLVFVIIWWRRRARSPQGKQGN